MKDQGLEVQWLLVAFRFDLHRDKTFLGLKACHRIKEGWVLISL